MATFQGGCKAAAPVLYHIEGKRRDVEDQVGRQAQAGALKAVAEDEAADEHRADIVADTVEALPFLVGHLPGADQLGSDFAAHGEAKQQPGR